MLVKSGANVTLYGLYVMFQLVEITVLREPVRNILGLIDELRPGPTPVEAEGTDGEEKAT